MRPKALDLFCGAGGVTEGLRLAGFDVTGVDISPQPHHRGGAFVQADALAYPLDGFDFIWASPPCQAHTVLRHLRKGKAYPDLIPAVRERLEASGIPYCIENVPGAPLLHCRFGCLTMLCGTMFGLQTPDGRAELRRHRWFETSFPLPSMACRHGHLSHERRKVITVTGHTPVDNTGRKVRNTARQTYSIADARAAMGIDWMPMKYLSQAIPPAYSHWIGRHALAHLHAGNP